jgi:hypothetical protein
MVRVDWHFLSGDLSIDVELLSFLDDVIEYLVSNSYPFHNYYDPVKYILFKTHYYPLSVCDFKESDLIVNYQMKRYIFAT